MMVGRRRRRAVVTMAVRHDDTVEGCSNAVSLRVCGSLAVAVHKDGDNGGARCARCEG